MNNTTLALYEQHIPTQLILGTTNHHTTDICFVAVVCTGYALCQASLCTLVALKTKAC